MAIPIQFNEQNDTLGGGHPSIIDLPCYRDGAQVISCWTPSPAELAEIMTTGQIWLVVKGQNQPPINVTGSYPFEKQMN